MKTVKAKLITKEKLEELYVRQRKTQDEIGKLYGVTGSAILYWRRVYNINSLKKSRDILLEPTSSLAYILGVLRGDGFIYINKITNCHFVLLSVIDRAFAQQFFNALINIGLSPKWIWLKPQQKNWSPQVKVYVESKQFVKWYKSMTLKIESSIINSFPLDFLRGMYDSEGSINWESKQLFTLGMVTTNKRTKYLVNSVLINQGFANVKKRERVLPSGKIAYDILLYRTYDIQKFLCLVQPSVKILPRSENTLIPCQANQGIG